MKKLLRVAWLVAVCLVLCGAVNAQERRPIDNRHPLWLVHIDVWNNADPQKIIDLIPEDIKPFVCLNLSLSCQYDKDLNIYKKPQNAVQTYRSWASVCCRNNMWFTCQPASGGHTHIPDNAANLAKALEIHESFFIDYKNFLGWNYAEQFWGFDESGDASSSKQVDRINLFAKLVPMHHKYGGFLTISFCGNIWSHALNPIGMMKRNSSLLKACRDYPEAILWLYKYTTSSCWYNNESVTIGPFISGLAKNYGVRYDNCGYNGALDTYLGENHGKKYPAAVGIAAVMEQMTLNGACVWDGPELIWTEDFRGISSTNVDGYTRRNWGTYPTFDNIWVDMFRKVIDGTIYIPTREEVVERTKIALIQNSTTGSDQDKYATPNGLYDGLYLQDNDPFNSQSSFNHSKGNYMSNLLFFKKTGRYQTIPMLMSIHDGVAKTIPNRVTMSVYSSKFPNQAAKVKAFNEAYPEVSKGDAFVARHHNELTCYYPYSYCNKLKTASAVIPLLYNTCDSLSLTLGKFSTVLAHENEGSISFYLNNYRSDTTTVQTDVIKVFGAKEKPAYTAKKRSAGTGRITEEWDEENGVYTLNLRHNGPYDITINCAGNNVDDRLTDVLDTTPLTELPLQPEDYYGDLIIEAEDMDYKSVEACVIDQYNDGWGAYRSIRGHSAMGFVKMGTNTAGGLRNNTQINHAGTYCVTIKYQSAQASRITSSFANSGNQALTLEATGSDWGYVSYETEAAEGINVFKLNNVGGKNFLVDNVTFTPIDVENGIDEIAVHHSGEPAFYTLSGVKLSAPRKGINIVRTADGKTKKVMLK